MSIGRTAIAVFGIIAALSGAALSHTRPRTPAAISVELVSDTRGALWNIPFQEQWKGSTFVLKQHLEARQGEVYSIVIRNDTPERVGLVIAVDGRNIINGKRSELGRKEAMYVVNGRDRASYDGWRTSSEQVHRFYFTDSRDSYTVKSFSDVSALGVIAVAVFREKEQPRDLTLEQSSRDHVTPAAPHAGAAGSEKRAKAGDNAATGFGDARYSPVMTVQFDPDDRPLRKTLIKYAWRETLCRNGVLDCGPQERRNRLWDNEGYAPYPPGHKRY